MHVSKLVMIIRMRVCESISNQSLSNHNSLLSHSLPTAQPHGDEDDSSDYVPTTNPQSKPHSRPTLDGSINIKGNIKDWPTDYLQRCSDGSIVFFRWDEKTQSRVFFAVMYVLPGNYNALLQKMFPSVQDSKGESVYSIIGASQSNKPGDTVALKLLLCDYVKHHSDTVCGQFLNTMTKSLAEYNVKLSQLRRRMGNSTTKPHTDADTASTARLHLTWATPRKSAKQCNGGHGGLLVVVSFGAEDTGTLTRLGNPGEP
jgi:hypothetical protein